MRGFGGRSVFSSRLLGKGYSLDIEGDWLNGRRFSRGVFMFSASTHFTLGLAAPFYWAVLDGGRVRFSPAVRVFINVSAYLVHDLAMYSYDYW